MNAINKIINYIYEFIFLTKEYEIKTDKNNNFIYSEKINSKITTKSTFDSLKNHLANYNAIYFYLPCLIITSLSIIIYITLFFLNIKYLEIYLTLFSILSYIVFLINFFHRHFFRIFVKYPVNGNFYMPGELDLFYLANNEYIWNYKKNSPGEIPARYNSITIFSDKSTILKSNIKVPGFIFNNNRLLFFPDFLLYEHQDKILIAGYKNIKLLYSETEFLESKYKPVKSKIIGKRFLHTTRKGLKDKRYAFNPQLDIYLYSQLEIEFEKNHLLFIISNTDKGAKFYKFIKERKSPGNKKEKIYKKNNSNKNKSSEENKVKIYNKKTANCYKILGLNPGDSKENIKKNYRKLVKKYHPDKPKNKNQGDDKIKEIIDSYQYLISNYDNFK